MPFPLTLVLSSALVLVAAAPAHAGATCDGPAASHVVGKPASATAAFTKPGVPGVLRGHQFVPPIAGVALIQFRVPNPNKPPEHQITRSTARAQDGFWCNVTEGERLRVEFRDASGALLHTLHDYVVPVGSEATIALPR